MRSGRFLLALAATATVAGPLEAQTAVSKPPARVGRTSDVWLDHYGQSAASETRVLRATGLGTDWDRIRPMVAGHPQQRSYPSEGPEQHAIQCGYHVDTTTNFLVRVGYRARHFAHPAQARTLVRAAN